jgi:hypothetical protein
MSFFKVLSQEIIQLLGTDSVSLVKSTEDCFVYSRFFCNNTTPNKYKNLIYDLKLPKEIGTIGRLKQAKQHFLLTQDYINSPLSNITKGNRVKKGERIARIAQVLKNNKGRPMSMLHFEQYLNSAPKIPCAWVKSRS